MALSKNERRRLDLVDRHFFWEGRDPFALRVATNQDLGMGSIDFETPRSRYNVAELTLVRGDLECNLTDFVPVSFTLTYFPCRASALSVYARDSGEIVFERLETQEELFGLFHALGHANIWAFLDPEELEKRHRARNAVLLGNMNRAFVRALIDEHQAWQWALGKIDDLRKEGIDPFPGITQEQFQRWIAEARRRYGCPRPEDPHYPLS